MTTSASSLNGAGASAIQVDAPARLLNRNFFLLWQGQAISTLGTQAASIAVLLWLKHATESATVIGLSAMIAAVPAVLLGPIGGSVADRYSRRNIIVASDVAAAFLTAALAVAMFLAPDAKFSLIVAMMVVSMLLSVLQAFFNPAITAAIPDLVPRKEVAGANSIIQGSFQIAVLIGQALGGTLFRLIGAPLIFLLDAISYAFSAVSESFVKIPQTVRSPGATKPAFLADLKQDTYTGCRYIWRRPGLRTLVLGSSLLGFFTVPFLILLPFYIEDTLHARPDWYGFMLSAYGVGSLIGSLTAGAIRLSGASRGLWMTVCVLLQSGGFLALSFLTDVRVAVALAASGGFVASFFTVNLISVVQLSTPSELRGRIFGLLGTLSMAISPVAMALTGLIADLTGRNIPMLYLGCGLFMVSTAIVLTANKDYRAFLRYEPPAGDFATGTAAGQ